MTAPTLTHSDLRDELEGIHRLPRRSRDTAFYGTGEAGEVTVTVDGREVTFRVLPARSELMLRRALAGRDGARPLALLVDFDTELPRDIAARVARGRIFYVDPGRRVKRRFKAKDVKAEVLRDQPLIRALLDGTTSEYAAISTLSLERDVAWRALLELWTGLQRDADLSAERVLAFAVESGRGPAFVERASAIDGLLEAARAFVGEQAGPLALSAWRAWERGPAVTLAGLLVILGAVDKTLRQGGGALRGFVESYFNTHTEDIGLDGKTALEQLGEAAPLGRLLPGRLSSEARQAVIARAESLIAPSADVRAAVVESTVLPTAFAQAKRSLAEALVACLERPGPQSARAVVEASQRLEKHELARAGPHRMLVERARMAARLALYLDVRSERADFASSADTSAPWTPMIELAAHYVSDGSFVDFARRVARGSEADALGAAIARVVRAADERRDVDDTTFATAMSAWVAAGRPRVDGVLPIEKALDRLAAELLAGGSHRRLLVLLLDGMSWADAVELLDDLEGRHGVAPIRWRPKRHRGAGPLPPVLAALPTLTAVSRAALFSGQAAKPGAEPATYRDPARFAAHRALRKVLDEDEPKLLLKSDVQAPGGHLSAKARKLVESEDRIVGLVVNAIDDQLKGSGQVRVAWRVETIKPLGDLLEAAAAARRAVLMLADHGHVPGDRLTYAAAPTQGGARWRRLGEGEAPAAGEIAVSGKGVWRPPGAEAVALLCGESHVFSAGSRHGEHGGAALAEVVAPAVLVADDRLADGWRDEAVEDPSLEQAPFAKPGWWLLREPEAPERRAAAAPAREERSVAAKPKPQLPLELEPASSQVARRLLAAPYFKGRPPSELKREVVPAVEALASAGGRLPADAFAQSVGVTTYRLAGFVAKLGEWLNQEGYQVIKLDRRSGQVVLDMDLFSQLFG